MYLVNGNKKTKKQTLNKFPSMDDVHKNFLEGLVENQCMWYGNNKIEKA